MIPRPRLTPTFANSQLQNQFVGHTRTANVPSNLDMPMRSSEPKFWHPPSQPCLMTDSQLNSEAIVGLGLLLAAISSALVPLLGAQDSSGGRPSEPTAVSQLKRASPGLAHFKTFLRWDVGAGRSLLVVAGSEQLIPDWQQWPDIQEIPWFPGDAVGIFLASGSPPEAVWSIETLVSDGDRALRIECVSSESITFLRTDGDYGFEQGAIKTVFDIDAQQAGQLLEFPTVGVRRFEPVDGQLYALLGACCGTHEMSQQVARITGGVPELLNPEDSRSVLASLSGTPHNALDAQMLTPSL